MGGRFCLSFAASVLTLLSIAPGLVLRTIHRMKIAIPIGIIVVFVLDLLTPLGIAVPMLYAGPVFTAGLLLRLELGFLTALCCTALTFAAYLLAPPGGISDYAGTNRLIASLLSGWHFGPRGPSAIFLPKSLHFLASTRRTSLTSNGRSRGHGCVLPAVHTIDVGADRSCRAVFVA